jgi:uncharacterized membrane protein
VLSRSIFWLWFAGLLILIAGILVRRKKLSTARGLDKLIALGPVFVASAIAVFGAEHLVSPRTLMQVVPVWMPARLFWAYFVGFALLAAAVSFVAMKFVRLAATLLGLMFVLFVLMIHVPNVVGNPKDRFLWAVALRELAFAGGAWALAGGRLVSIARFLMAIPLMFFGVEHFLHPTFAPGVPLARITPAWVPAPAVWGYLIGALLLMSGVALLVGLRSRTALTWTGLALTLLVVLLYLPILAAARPAGLLEAVNYVGDTLLFAGAVLCVAGANVPS